LIRYEDNVNIEKNQLIGEPPIASQFKFNIAVNNKNMREKVIAVTHKRSY